MADRYTSQIALVLDQPLSDVGAVIGAARAARDIDRSAPVASDPASAHEVHWGGRMQKAVVRHLTDTGEPLLRTEAYVGAEGLEHGMQRQAQLLQALTRQLPDRVRRVRDLSAMADRDSAWVNRVAVGSVEYADAIEVLADGDGTWWVRTHGAARFDVPDLELYGLARAHVDAAAAAIEHVHGQLLAGGLKEALSLPDGTPVYLVPVLEAWQHLPFDWPGVGRAGVDRGPGLDGPRASLSVLHRPRFGKYKRDFAGVVGRLAGAR
ncbi:MAG: hypothetical protein WD377_08265 [Nitriliruptoraceae bacterium]